MAFNTACGNGFPLNIGGEGGAGTGGTAAETSYDNTDSGLTATNVQAAIDELSGDISDLTAADIAYDNTDSGLAAANAQAAIDEMVTNFGAGVDSVYNACVSAGSTPASKSPSDIATAIGAISAGGAIQLFLQDDTSHHDYPTAVTHSYTAPDDGYILYGGINYVSSASLKINNVEKFRGFGNYYFGGNGAVQVSKNDTIVVSYQGNDSQVSIGIFFTPSLTVPNNNTRKKK